MSSRDAARHDRRWFEEQLPARLESAIEYDQVAGAWARARRSASPYHDVAFEERAARLLALLRAYEEEVTDRADADRSGERGAYRPKEPGDPGP
jgi:hypothetical protein